MTLDILDAIAHPTGFEEFIILASDADFTPVLLRLREHDRRTMLINDRVMAAALRAACDLVVPQDRFIAEALGMPAEKPTEARTEPPTPASEAAPRRARSSRKPSDPTGWRARWPGSRRTWWGSHHGCTRRSACRLCRPNSTMAVRGNGRGDP